MSGPAEEPFLSLVIPAYNEEQRIGKTLEKVLAYFSRQSYSYEVIVVDDGSRDRTGQIVAEIAGNFSALRLLPPQEHNSGKGSAVKKGMLAARGRHIAFSDADLSTPIEEMEKLLHWIGQGYDVAIGSRDLKDSDVRVHQPWYRETMGRIFNRFVKLVALSDFEDTQCGFKCLKGPAAKSIFSRMLLDRFCFDVEMLWIAKKDGCRIKEVPVIWSNERHSRVHPVIDASRMLSDLVRLRWNDRRGRYE